MTSKFKSIQPMNCNSIDEEQSTSNSSFDLPMYQPKEENSQKINSIVLDVLEEQEKKLKFISPQLAKKKPLIKQSKAQFDSADYFMKLYQLQNKSPCQETKP